MRSFVIILATFAALPVCDARVITVDDDAPADFDNIQAAIDDANDGDTVLVADGTYHCPWPDGITFRGKAITVRSENGPRHCVVDGRNIGRCFIFESGEDGNSVLDGFTITNGRETGAGIYCTFSSPTVINCVITNNTAPIVCDYSGLPPYCGALRGCEKIDSATQKARSCHWQKGCFALFGDFFTASERSRRACPERSRKIKGFFSQFFPAPVQRPILS